MAERSGLFTRSRSRAAARAATTTASASISAARMMPTHITDLPDLAHYLIVLSMDSATRAAWRLVCRRACDDVYAAASCLSWAVDAWPVAACNAPQRSVRCCERIAEALPNRKALLSKCILLKRLSCEGMKKHATAIGNLGSRHRDDLHNWLIEYKHLGGASTSDSDDWDDDIVDCVCIPTGLEYLNVSGIDIGNLFRYGLSETQVSSLRELHMRNVDLGMWDCEMSNMQNLRRAFCDMSNTLVRLDLAGAVLFMLERESLEGLASALKGMKKLEWLSLNHCGIGDDGFHVFATVLSHLTTLRHLDLNNNYITDASSPDLAMLLGPLQSLTFLSFWDNKACASTSLPVLAPVLCKLTGLRQLCMSEQLLASDDGDGADGNTCVNQLFPIIRAQPDLEVVELASDCLNLSELSILASAIQPLTKLTRLVFCATLLGFYEGPFSYCVPGVSGLLPVVAQLTNLLHLDLTLTCGGPANITALSQCLPHLVNLRELVLSGCLQFLVDNEHDMFPRTAAEEEEAMLSQLRPLVKALEQCTQLRGLRLDHNHLGLSGACLLAPALGCLVHLQQLDLSDNALHAEPVSALAPALKSLTCLTRLALAENLMGRDGMEQLRDITALENGQPRVAGLLELNLSSCLDAGDVKGLQSMAKVLKCCTQLRGLWLGGNNMGLSGVRALVPTLTSLACLQQLDLSGNKLRASAAKALVPVLRCLTRLRSLWLCHNMLKDEGVKVLAPELRALPPLKHLDLGSNEVQDTDDVYEMFEGYVDWHGFCVD